MSKSYAKPRILPTVILLLLAIVPHASAKTFRLHPLGNTLIEAENCTATSENFPYAEPCKQCSGGQNLGYFWKDSWFEIEVHVVTDCDYHVSMRTSSVEGSSLQLLGVDDEGEFREIEQIEIPKTGNWREYTSTDTFKLRLAAGTHRMRFKNLIDGANVDYLTFAVVDDGIVSYRLPKDEGPNKNPLKGFGSAWWRPDDEYASVGFQYIEWGGFEPQDDQFDWDYVEEVLNRDGSRGRHLILQFVVDWDTRTPVDDNYLGPEWLLEKVGEHRGHANPDDPTSRLMRATKYNDPTYIQEAQEAIRALTNYFKDDPRVFVLQAG
ncbi:MAG: carbohydrate-binding protein, partial [Planctomycetota bacterium]